jgi:hypothetical protein
VEALLTTQVVAVQRLTLAHLAQQVVQVAVGLAEIIQQTGQQELLIQVVVAVQQDKIELVELAEAV